MPTFYLVRHAAKDVKDGVLSGRTPDVHLTDEGRRQAERIARRLADEPIGYVYSSPLARARETAQPLARRKCLKVQTAESFGEIDFGAWTNEAVADLESVDRWQRHHHFRSGVRIPDGELLMEVQARFVGRMLELCEQAPDGGIAVFSHGDPIKLAVAYFAGVPLDLFSRFEIRPASISALAVGAYGPKILRLNERASR